MCQKSKKALRYLFVKQRDTSESKAMQYEKFLFFAKHKLGISTLALGIFEISEGDHP
jgi:hypothetical protein